MITARAALRHANRLAADGIPLSAEQALTPAQVEHTIATVFHPEASAAGTSRAGALRAAARTLNPAAWPAMTPGAGRKPRRALHVRRGRSPCWTPPPKAKPRRGAAANSPPSSHFPAGQA